MSMRVFSCQARQLIALSDSVFVLEIDPSTKSLSALSLPPALVSFIRIIVLDSEWDRSKTKGKPPKPRIDSLTLNVMKGVLEKRLEDYRTTLQVGFSGFATIDGALIHIHRKTRRRSRRQCPHSRSISVMHSSLESAKNECCTFIYKGFTTCWPN